METIVNVNSEKFSINGIEYYKTFMPYVSGQTVQIVSAYDWRFELLNFTLFSDVEVDGNTFGSIAALQTALLPVLFSRTAASGGGNTTDMLPYVSIGDSLIRKGSGNSDNDNIESGDYAVSHTIQIDDGQGGTEPANVAGSTLTGADPADENDWEQVEVSVN